jgi:preprotein translocase subunit SecG
MYTFLIVLILIASILLVLAVLVQNPKSGMASNFGASNQVMGVRQTADFLEKFTWGAAVTILALTLLSIVLMDKPGSEDAVLAGDDTDAPAEVDNVAGNVEPAGNIAELEGPADSTLVSE